MKVIDAEWNKELIQHVSEYRYRLWKRNDKSFSIYQRIAEIAPQDTRLGQICHIQDPPISTKDWIDRGKASLDIAGGRKPTDKSRLLVPGYDGGVLRSR